MGLLLVRPLLSAIKPTDFLGVRKFPYHTLANALATTQSAQGSACNKFTSFAAARFTTTIAQHYGQQLLLVG